MLYIRIIFLTLIPIVILSCNSPNEKNRAPSIDLGIKQNIEFILDPNTVDVIKNPCTGWGLYDDAYQEVANADEFWKEQDKHGTQYASFLYIRWRWSDMEPEEGKYAWKYNENYKKLIQGARDRGLKLSFRIYNNSRDNLRPSTPLFVKEQGAEGYLTNDGKDWTPYIDDPIFQEKLENFVKAFAEEYDDPSIVDFVDGINVGSWGECHGLEIRDITKEKAQKTLDQIAQIYSRYFKKVILIMPVNSQFTFEIEKPIAVDTYGYGFRRDGLGSQWFSKKEQNILKKHFDKILFLGESCYWQGNEFGGSTAYQNDKVFPFKTWREVYEATLNQALDFRFNTLDLRTPIESRGWLHTAPDLVQRFIEKGGYRIYPNRISVPDKARPTETISLAHQWTNLGTGVCPNNNPRWNQKYKAAFALIDKQGNIVHKIIDNHSNPNDFLQEKVTTYTLETTLPALKKGTYSWAIALIDTTMNNEPGLNLATRISTQKGWTPFATISIKE